jgi:hypothetical protein
MPLTKGFKELVQRRVAKDAEFAKALENEQAHSSMLDPRHEMAEGLHGGRGDGHINAKPPR